MPRKPVIVRRWAVVAAFVLNVAAIVVAAVLFNNQYQSLHLQVAVTRRQAVVNKRQIAVNHRQLLVNRRQLLLNRRNLLRLCRVNHALGRTLHVALSGPRPPNLTPQQLGEIDKLTAIEKSLKRDRCRASRASP
jgi:hypothetical protein